jgi:hypothetical protein
MAAGLGRLPDDLRALLAGLAMLAGLDLMVDVGANGPAVLGGVLHALLAGTGAGAAGGTGAGAAGAGAALAPALAAAVVVGLVLGGIYVGNRAAREFGRRARRLLRDQRAEAAARLQADVENLLRLTGEILEARLRTALRTDDVTINRVALTQAVKDMQRACSRMIEALGAGAVV